MGVVIADSFVSLSGKRGVSLGQDGGVHLESFLAQAEELLAIESTAERPEDLRRALELVLSFVGSRFTVERFESNGKPSALVYCGPARPEFRLILNGHLDVVPGGPEQFRPHRDGDRLYGRGTHDMKVSALVQAQVFGELAGGLPYPVALQLVTDEEVGGRDGTLHQIEQGVRGQFVIIGEQSGLNVVAESKGLLHAHLRAAGRAGHSAYQWLGDNALITLMASLNRLLARYPVATEEIWRTTVNVARIHTTNRAFNQVPADATAWLDIRFPPEDADLNGRTVEEISEYLRGFCAPGATIEVDRVDAPHRAAVDRGEVRMLQQAAQRQGYPADFLRKHGAADGRFYSQRGIDAVIFGIGGDGQHGPDEYVDITTIVPYHRTLTEFLEALDS
jgi:succinyl-diaminopimelate desuccinylase